MADKSQVGRESIELAAQPNGATTPPPSATADDKVFFTRKRVVGFYATTLLMTLGAVAITGVHDMDVASASIAFSDEGAVPIPKSQVKTWCATGWCATWDIDGDGVVSDKEFEDGFTNVDRDGDGQLFNEEITRANVLLGSSPPAPAPPTVASAPNGCPLATGPHPKESYRSISGECIECSYGGQVRDARYRSALSNYRTASSIQWMAHPYCRQLS